jgi:predicted nucleic acid-binding protein
VAFLFDTDAVSELLKPKPAPTYVRWLRTIPREDQFVSAVTVGELYQGAFRSHHRDRHLERIEGSVLPAVTVLPFDAAVARTYGQIRAELESMGKPLADADLQIAATALYHGLELVTGNLRHFRRVPGLLVTPVLFDAKASRA